MPHPLPAFSTLERRRWFDAAADEPCDLLIIGGGINGAAIFRDATLRGLKCLLVEKGDFASGTSSKSSKLLHGGLRYLLQGRVRQSRISLLERNRLLRQVPQLIEPVPIMIPHHKGDGPPPWAAGFVMWAYEALSAGNNLPRHATLTRDEVRSRYPHVRDTGLRGGVLFHECRLDDARMTLETIKAGVASGGRALNYVSAEQLHRQDDRVNRVEIRDTMTSELTLVQPRAEINATGVWVDDDRFLHEKRRQRLVHASMGVHVVFPHGLLDLPTALSFRSPKDGRYLFLVPGPHGVLYGTTDSYYHGKPEQLKPTERDLNYMAAALKHILPGHPIRMSDAISVYVGLRPLFADGSHIPSQKASREHRILREGANLWSVSGGKLTTHRHIAEEAVNLVMELPEGSPSPTRDQGLFDDVAGSVAASGATASGVAIPEISVRHLHRTYGPFAPHLLNGGAPELVKPLAPNLAPLMSEIPFACRHESALHLADVVLRRMRIGVWNRSLNRELLLGMGQVMGKCLGWTDAVVHDQVHRVAEEIRMPDLEEIMRS